MPKKIAKSDSKVAHSFHFMKLPVELQRYIVCLAALDWQSSDVRLLKGDYVTLDELRQNGFKLSKGALALREVSRHFNQLMMDNGKGPGCLSVFTPRKQSDIEACLLGSYPRVVRLKEEGLEYVMQDSFLQKFSEQKSETQHWPSRIEVFMDSERNIESLSTLALHETLSQRVVFVKIKSCDTKRLEGLKDFPYLETLTIDVGTNGRPEFCAPVLKDFNSLPNLPKLSYLRIIARGILSFEGLEKLPSLKKLTIDVDTDLDRLDYFVNVLKDFNSLPNLPNLSDLSVIARSILSFEGLEKLPSLKKLTIDVAFLEEMKGLKNCYQLSSICVKSMGLSGIAGMRDLPALEDLHILSFHLPDTVGDLANLPTLRKLSIISEIENVEKIK
ncbi:MAG: hypothetical protein ACPG7U_00630, partial [Holosporaceae bacterium]